MIAPPAPRRVFLVEDSDADAILITRAFAKAGLVAPTRADNGDAAVEHLADTLTSGSGPDLILLDLKLPRRSGFEVLSWARAQHALRHTPIVVLTSSREDDDVLRAYEQGATSYLVKPVAVDALNGMVRALDTYWLGLDVRPDRMSL